MRITSVLPLVLLSPFSLAQDADPASTTPPPAAPRAFRAPLAGGPPAMTIFTNLAGHPSAAVPGLGGIEFRPGTGDSQFDRVYGSPNGHWTLTALANLPLAEDEVLIVDGELVARQGSQAPWAAPGEDTDFIDTKLAINDAGTLATAINTDATFTSDEYIVTRDAAGLWTVVAHEGDATGLVGLPGTTYGDPLDSPAIDAAGNVSFAADGVTGGNLTTDTDDFLIVGGLAVMQEGVTLPPGQAGAEFIESYDLTDLYVSADGSSWLVQGDLTGDSAADDVLIVDGAVVIQEGQVLAGSGYTEVVDGPLLGVFMDGAGHWYARGDNAGTNLDWVVRDGAVIAARGQAFDGTSAELWDDSRYSDCFFLHVGNASGDYVVGGVTDHADPLRDGVLVKNGSTEVVRQGDPIDLDGNGLFDDDAYFDTFGNDDAHLTDDGWLLLVATIMDDSGTRIGQGLFRIDTNRAPGTSYCQAGANSLDPGGARIAAEGSASLAIGQLTLIAGPAPAEPFLYYYGPNQISQPFGNGSRCVGGTTVRLPAGVGANGELRTTLDFAAHGSTFAALCTVNFQGWYRDPLGLGAFFNLTDGLEIVFQP